MKLTANKNGETRRKKDEFTRVGELDIDFRVSSGSQAVVKDAENFSVQEFVKKIESHPHREALQADLHQNIVNNPFGLNSKDHPSNWAMWSYSSCAKQDQKCNVLNVFSIGIKELCIAFADNSWLTANPEESLTN